MTAPSNRRRQAVVASLAGSGALVAAGIQAATPTASAGRSRAAADPKPTHDMSAFPPHWHGRERIGMILYPGFTALDLVGPQYMFANLMGATVDLLAANRSPVRSDTGLSIVPTQEFGEAKDTFDVFFVPGGGQGTLDAMRDERLIEFVAGHGGRAKWVVSVCTGSLILGQAGLLDGYRATSHWVTRDLLPVFGARPVDQRVVRDRNRMTGAGVSAGLDLGLKLVGELRDPLYAQATQLLAEYAPQPPWRAGSPRTAPPRATELIGGMFTGLREQVTEIARSRRAPPGRS